MTVLETLQDFYAQNIDYYRRQHKEAKKTKWVFTVIMIIGTVFCAVGVIMSILLATTMTMMGIWPVIIFWLCAVAFTVMYVRGLRDTAKFWYELSNIEFFWEEMILDAEEILNV